MTGRRTDPAHRAQQPTAAELARTAAVRGTSALHAVGIGCGPHLAATATSAGEVLVVVPAGGAVDAAVRSSPLGDVPARLSFSDCVPGVPRPQVRTRLELSGWLDPVRAERLQEAVLAFAEVSPSEALLDVGLTSTLLRLDLAEGVVEGCGERTELTREEFAAARPDPVALAEEEVLTAARGPLAALVHRVQHWAGPRESVQLLNVDRYGVTCRVHGRRTGYDLRVPFAAVVERVEEVPEAVRQLTVCAHDLAGDATGRDQPRR